MGRRETQRDQQQITPSKMQRKIDQFSAWSTTKVHARIQIRMREILATESATSGISAGDVEG